MIPSMSLAEAQKNLQKLRKHFEASDFARPVALTENDKPIMALMPWELYEELLETLEVVLDEELVMALRKGIRDVNCGRALSIDQFQ